MFASQSQNAPLAFLFFSPMSTARAWELGTWQVLDGLVPTLTRLFDLISELMRVVVTCTSRARPTRF